MEHRARKRFGQNFLIDDTVVERALAAIAAGPDQVIIEIGPGQGALTTHLADSGAELHLLEIDRNLAADLERTFGDRDWVQVHCGDALQTDLAALCQERPFRVVGNLPYNISTPLLFHILEWRDRIVDMHFMLQHEVVLRMAAQPGSKAWGRLSVMCQLHCAVTPLFDVPPEAFRPKPKVRSSFVRLQPHDRPPVLVSDPVRFERLVARAFSMRRKTLRNSLRGMLDAGQMAEIGIDPGLRPEQLSLADFAALAERVGRDHDSGR